MKKSLLRIFSVMVLSLLASYVNPLKAQLILYEGFDYTLPGYIGGNGNAGSASNNWTTHSVTSGQITTVDLASGNLTYSGLQTPTGNKVYLFGNANATSRDINRAFTSTNSIIFYSALINIIDNSQITTTGDYFMHVAQTSGTSVTVFGGRLGVKSVNGGANYRFMIQNTSGGTPTFTELAQDMNFGTTYLVVVKYDRSVNPTSASLWVNPTPLGGSEPSGSVTNNSGTGTFSGFASICMRNNATTPKAEIDEVRVGVSFADVTPGPADVNPPEATFSPVNASTGILTWIKPAITFNEPVRKTDGTPLTNTDLSTLITFKKTDASGADVPFTATIDAQKELITITPSSNLDNSQIYYLAIGPVEDASGNEALAKNVTFTTVSGTTPVITLTWPLGGEKMYAGQAVTVTWNSANITNVFVEVWALDNTTRTYSWIPYIASTPAAPGSVNNSVPSDATYGTEYKIRVSDLSNPSVSSTGGNFTIISVKPTLAALRNDTKENDIVKYTGTATVTYARTANYQKYIQDATGAILVHDPTGYIPNTYAIGDGITNIEGKNTLYNGLLELVPLASTGATATGTAIVPPVVDITTLTTADQCKLVKIKNLRFATPNQWDAVNGFYVASKNYDIAGLSNASYAIRTAFTESDYIGTVVPADAFDAVVLVGQYLTQMQITPRNLADITMLPTGISKLAENGLTIYPVPASAFLNVKNMQNVTNIEILDVTGKLVLKMETNDQSELKIPVSNLTRGMYFIKFISGESKVIKRFIKS